MTPRNFEAYVELMELRRQEQNLQIDCRIANRELNDYLDEHEMKNKSEYDVSAKSLEINLCELHMELAKVHEKLAKNEHNQWFVRMQELI